MIAFLVALVADPAIAVADPTASDLALGSKAAFYCVLAGDEQAGGEFHPNRNLNVLLDKFPHEGSGAKPLATYDPTSLLGFAKFNSLSISPHNTGYSLTAKSLGGSGEYLLVLAPKGGEAGKFGALLGSPGDTQISAGYCSGPVALNSESEFADSNKRGGE
jgi:hypothetical protein